MRSLLRKHVTAPEEVKRGEGGCEGVRKKLDADLAVSAGQEMESFIIV